MSGKSDTKKGGGKTIFFHNTLTGKKEKFQPIKTGFVGMYNCGPTVYLYPHLGNLRSYVLADTIKRVLKQNSLEVKQVINITDVGHLTGDADSGEDKVEKEAAKEKKSAKEITAFYTEAFMRDLTELNIDTGDTIFPKASEHIPEQIELIKKLEEKGFTYRTSDGIYFDTSKFKDYGKLGGIDLRGIKEGARIGVNEEKKNPTDFALWKFSEVAGKRQQEWESPWGTGFPGWHIECSAMSMKYLGETFDIHTGGIDHIGVHHNNEIAQSESATGKKFANYWMHNAFVNVPGGKMAKSEGNFTRLENLIEKGVNPLAYRYFLLGAHYRTPVVFSLEAIEGAEKALERLVDFAAKNISGGKIIPEYQEKFSEAVNDDLDTPKALAIVWEMVKDEKFKPEDRAETLFDFDKVLGLDILRQAEEEKKADSEIPDEVKRLAEEREKAREEKNWEKSDELRNKISDLGYEANDTPDGQKLKKKKA